MEDLSTSKENLYTPEQKFDDIMEDLAALEAAHAEHPEDAKILGWIEQAKNRAESILDAAGTPSREQAQATGGAILKQTVKELTGKPSPRFDRNGNMLLDGERDSVDSWHNSNNAA